MKKSRYEKYVVRKPAIVKKVGDKYIDVMPEGDKIPNERPEYTGPRVIISKETMPPASTIIEYCYVTGDTVVGTGVDFVPHKHDYEEIFIFLGTNPEDTMELGAEIDFYLGEGPELEKVTLTKSATVYVPAGLAHFPQVWKNVRKPVFTMVVMPDAAGKKNVIPVSMEGRMK